MRGIFASDSNIKIGIIVTAFGLLLLIIRFFFDLAAKVTAAKKEYSAIMSSGLIAGTYSANKDTTLIKTIDSSGKTRSEAPKSPENQAFEPGKAPKDLRREGQSTDPKSFAPTGPLKPQRKALKPREDCSRYLTAPLKPAE